jgi:hypothetical protein
MSSAGSNRTSMDLRPNLASRRGSSGMPSPSTVVGPEEVGKTLPRTHGRNSTQRQTTTHAPPIVFGPVKSRRLGWNLGINTILPKTCTCSFVYCQTLEIRFAPTPDGASLRQPTNTIVPAPSTRDTDGGQQSWQEHH